MPDLRYDEISAYSLQYRFGPLKVFVVAASPCDEMVKKRPQACPSCGSIFEAPITNSRKCPDCREKIVVRTHPDTKEKLLLSEEGAKEFDTQKKSRSQRNKAIRKVAALGLDESAFLKHEKKLLEEFGSTPSPGDVYWSAANSRVLSLGRKPKENAQMLNSIYWAMGHHLLDEGRSKKHVQALQKKSHKWELVQMVVEFEYLGQDRNAVIDAANCCDTCEIRNREEFTVEGATEDAPLPQEECENDWCTCMWVMGKNPLPGTKGSRPSPYDIDIEGSGKKVTEKEEELTFKEGCLFFAVILIGMALFLGACVVLI